AASDGVIHTAFIHDFSNLAAAGETDRLPIEAIRAALPGSGTPFLLTSRIGVLADGRVGTEDDAPDPGSPVAHRLAAERAALALASRGVRASLVSLPPSAHGAGDHGFVPVLIQIAREKGVSAYVGDGSNRWPAVHRLDAANLYRLALEKGPAEATLLGVADEGVPTREIAEVIGRRLNVPVVSKPSEQAGEHFGWLGAF